MRVALTGATGFIGRYIARRLAAAGHEVKCWYRPTSDRDGLDADQEKIKWVPGELGNAGSVRSLVSGCDVLVHAALYRVGPGFRGGEGDLPEFVRKNVVQTIELFEAARANRVSRIIFISTCAVHEKILDDRALDETHPLWPTTFYGAHKAALEKFIHAYGYGVGYPICALRPVGVYGLAHPAQQSKWYEIVQSVVRGEDVHCDRGGKEVHADDVAKAVEILLEADGIAGEAYNCCDGYISHHEVATLAKHLARSKSGITGGPTKPKHQISTDKLEALGMKFGGDDRVRETVRQLVDAIGAT